MIKKKPEKNTRGNMLLNFYSKFNTCRGHNFYLCPLNYFKCMFSIYTKNIYD